MASSVRVIVPALCAAVAVGCSPRAQPAVPIGARAAAGAEPPSPLLTAPDRFFTVGDTTLRYREIGRGEPVVLLHGYSARLERYRSVADPLARTHRVIAVDVRGFGGSSAFSDPALYGQAMVADVVRLLDHLRLRRAHLVGHSMGAVLAANLAQAHPDRVATLTLAAGPFFADSAATVAYFAPHLAALERGEGLRSFLAANYPALGDSALAEVSREAMARNHPGALLAVGRSFHALAVQPTALSAHQPAVPTLVIVGTADPLLPLSRRLAAWWPSARLVEVEGADHGRGLLDHPRFLPELQRHLAGGRERTGATR